jgi:hypothetical protein
VILCCSIHRIKNFARPVHNYRNVNPCKTGTHQMSSKSFSRNGMGAAPLPPSILGSCTIVRQRLQVRLKARFTFAGFSADTLSAGAMGTHNVRSGLRVAF